MVNSTYFYHHDILPDSRLSGIYGEGSCVVKLTDIV